MILKYHAVALIITIIHNFLMLIYILCLHIHINLLLLFFFVLLFYYMSLLLHDIKILFDEGYTKIDFGPGV